MEISSTRPRARQRRRLKSRMQSIEPWPQLAI